MKKLVYDILGRVSGSGVKFADVRFTSDDSERYFVERGELKSRSESRDDANLGIRVLIDGCYGFAGTNDLSPSSVDKTLAAAVSNARTAAQFIKRKIEFPAQKPVTGSYFQKVARDPFLMDGTEKTNRLLSIGKALHAAGNGKIVYDFLYVSFYRQYRVYANTEGTFTDSLVYHVEPFARVISSDGTGTQNRTYPGDMCARPGGFEVVEDYRFEENFERIAGEAVDLLTAPRVEEERTDIILGGSQLALQLHESVGHATESDRIFGMEISYAGKTFVKPEMIGSFRYGSEAVNIVSDTSDPRGMGYRMVDDDGVAGRRTDIVKGGILAGQQTSRETAARLGLEPSSNMTATHAFNIPLIRMTNFNLLPGKGGSLKDLIASTEKGYLLDFTRTWSIDDNRRNFQFTTEIGWKIRDGKITGIVKEPTYYGITPEFWGSCDAVCGEDEWRYYGTFNCGKGEPGQAMHLSHGVAPARFRNVVANVKA